MTRDGQSQTVDARQVVVLGACYGSARCLESIVHLLQRMRTTTFVSTSHPAVTGRAVDPGGGSGHVKIVEGSDLITWNAIHAASVGDHLAITRRMVLGASAPDDFLGPIDRLFMSSAAAFGAGVTAIVLSGIADDGVEGSRRVVNGGGSVLVLDPDEAVYSALPLRLVRSFPWTRGYSLPEITGTLERRMLLTP